MNIEEIRAAREAAELEIRAIMERFKSDTGLSLIACDVDAVTLSTLGQATPSTYLTRVRLTVESI